MNEPIPSPQELAEAHDLISWLCDGRLAPEQAVRLRELLSQYRQARRLYLRLMHLEAALNLNIASGQTLVADETEPEPTGLRDLMILPAAPPSVQIVDGVDRSGAGAPPAAIPSGGRLREVPELPRFMRIGNPQLIRWLGAAAAVLCVGLVVAFLVRRRSPATITDSFDARFDGEGLSAAPGTRLAAAHDVRLSHGLVELTLAGGARVLVEAPAVFSIDSPGAMTLDIGRISAVASGAAHGFQVNTPTAKVVDLGTKFGVCVGTFGATDVQVFSGKVVVSPLGSAAESNSSPASQILSTGDAAEVDSGVVKLIAGGASPQAFVRTLAPPTGPIDAVDLASGGDGTTHNRSGQIAPVSGRTADRRTPGTANNADHAYHQISNLAVFDGCFIPSGSMQVDSGGHRFEFPQTAGGSFIYMTAAGKVQWPVSDRTVQPWLGGVDYSRPAHGFILAHSNCGFTIDLAALRRIHPSLHLSHFTAVVGSTYSDPQGLTTKAGAYVLVDGAPRFERQGFVPRDGAIQIDVPLSGTDRFLTLAVINESNNNHDWVIFGDPQLN
jgi:hypothetical protein